MTEPWELRFTTPQITEVRWASRAPERLGVVSTESGESQAWMWDLRTGERRQASRGGVGAEEVHVMPAGDAVVWWLDPLGDERGRWMVSPFDGGDASPLFPSLEDAWMAGISIVPGAVAAGFSTDDDYVVYVSHEDREPRELYRHAQPAGVGAEWPQGAGGLSADGALLCIRHAEDGDITHYSLRVLDARSGEVVRELKDEGLTLQPAGWSPIPGDQRLVVTRELDDAEHPWLWNPAEGILIELRTDEPGAIFHQDWYPDGRALLLRQDHGARDALLRFDLDAGATTVVVPASGTVSQATVRGEEDVWFRAENGIEPPAIRNLAGEVVLEIPGVEPPPRGRSFEAVSFANPSGGEIQGWLIRPDGKPPFPTIVSPHGGPEYHNTDAFDPRRLAYADHGFAILLVNYRGSTGYGAEFRRQLQGDVGFPESEDLNAGLDHLIEEGIADPDRLFIEGWSWGGYLATLNAGLHPERWRAVVAGIPVGDSVAAHYECAPALRAWDIATMGGSPMEVPALYHERNPMTYIDRVRAPVLFIAGERDSRCPLGQVMTYAHGLRARGREVQVHLYPGGHHAHDVQERIAEVRLTLDFLLRYRD